jgi:hypothetical protein
VADSCTSPVCMHACPCSLTRILQFAKPMWPFMTAGVLTFYLVGKAQDMGVKGTLRFPVPSRPAPAPVFSLSLPSSLLLS